MDHTTKTALSFKFIPVLLAAFLMVVNVLASPHRSSNDLIFSTYLGGELADRATDIAIDSQGSAYITGVTQSTIFPTLSTFKTAQHGLDTFVAKISPDGQELLYVLWFNAVNAADVDQGLGITVDEQGHAYVTGHTRSADFCTFFGQVPGYQTTYNGDGDAFLFKVLPDGSGLQYCTFIGGSDWDSATAVVIDRMGRAIITGSTWSTDFPTTEKAFNNENSGQRDLFLTMLNGDGSRLLYSTYLGGESQEQALDLAAVADKRFAVTGWTNSENFPTTPNSFDTSFNGVFDAFVAQIDLQTGMQTYGTYLGSTGEDRAHAIAVTKENRILLAGTVAAVDGIPQPHFPTTPGAYKKEIGGKSDAFLVKFNEQGTELAYSTLMGGAGQEQGLALSLNNNDEIILSGITNSEDLPTTSLAFQQQLNGEGETTDAFISHFDSTGSRLLYSSYYGGDQEDGANAISFFDNEDLFLTGFTRSENFPTTPGAPSRQNRGDYDAFIARIKLPPPATYTLFFPFILHNQAVHE